MTTRDFSAMEAFSTAVAGSEREVSSVYCSDLLSWAMGYAPAGSAWCTVIGNVNTVAVASLADVAAIVLCENAVLDEAAKTRAELEGIPVLQTALPAFEAALAVARRAGLHGL